MRGAARLVESAHARQLRVGLLDERRVRHCEPRPVRHRTGGALDFLWEPIPVIRQPYAAGDRTPFWAGGPRIVGRHHLYDLANDPDELENRTGESDEQPMIDLLHSALQSLAAPDDQFERLGLRSAPRGPAAVNQQLTG